MTRVGEQRQLNFSMSNYLKNKRYVDTWLNMQQLFLKKVLPEEVILINIRSLSGNVSWEMRNTSDNTVYNC